MKQKQERLSLSTAFLVLAAALALGGTAQSHEMHGGRRDGLHEHRGIARAGHEFRAVRAPSAYRYGAGELTHWRGGQWAHRCFGGRCGWWWHADGQWFCYGRPVYPYPPIVSGVVWVEPGLALPAMAARAYLSVPRPGPYPYE